MDLVGEMLLREWRENFGGQTSVRTIQLEIPRLARSIPVLGDSGVAFNADRLVTRFLRYPLRAMASRRGGEFFHVVDHSYAHVVHALPSNRTGVYCHDLDAFRSILEPARDPRPAWFRSLARATLNGMKKARLVFHNSAVVRDEIMKHRLTHEDRLVHAPLGVAPEFCAEGPEGDVDEILKPLGGRPFLLHVGSALPRKRLDVLASCFQRLREDFPELRLVQQGAALSRAQRTALTWDNLAPVLLQPPRLTRTTLASLYRRAALVLVPSDAEGFGFPVIEALACGGTVVASDIPVLREVGGDAAVYCPVGNSASWASMVGALLRGSIAPPTHSIRVAQAARFTWREHARIVLAAYQAVAANEGRAAR